MAECETAMIVVPSEPLESAPVVENEDAEMLPVVESEDAEMLPVIPPKNESTEAETGVGVTVTEPVLEPELELESQAETTEMDDKQGLEDLVRDIGARTPETEIVEGGVSVFEADMNDVKETPKEEVDDNDKKQSSEVAEAESSNSNDTNVNTNSVTLTEAEENMEENSGVTAENEDIICLESDDEPGASSSKRPRTDNGETAPDVPAKLDIEMEKETAVEIVSKMSRCDLEDLVLAKIVEAIVAHTEVGHLRAKVLELQLQKDKLAAKMMVMQKQTAELSTAVRIISENEARDPRNRVAKPNVIRFNRSVGLQTTIEPSVRSAPPKIIRVPESSQNGVKQYGASLGKQTTYSATNGTNFNVPQGQAVKRVYQGNKPGNSQTATIQPSPRKTYSPAGSTGPPRIHPIAPKPVQIQNQSVTVTPIPAVQPGIVDLTDDDPPSASTASTSSAANSSGTTYINGVQYQIVNRQATPGNLQIVPGTQQQKFIVTPTTQRPVVIQQVAVGAPGGQNQQIMLRGVNSPITVVQRPVAPRPTANGGAPRVAATIPVRTPTGVVLGTASNTPRRFVLPPLPATPIAKVKNDMFRPPPKPELTLNEQADGIVLSWNLPSVNNMAEVTTYQIFACQESMSTSPNRPSQWKRVGDVKALPLPMACTLSQFTEENRYYFIVRGIDVYGRVGPFCDPQNILLRRKK